MKMKKVYLASLFLLLTAVKVFPQIDLLEIIEDTYGQTTWSNKPDFVTTSVWDFIITRDQNFLEALDAVTQDNKIVYEDLKKHIQEIVQFFEYKYQIILVKKNIENALQDKSQKDKNLIQPLLNEKYLETHEQDFILSVNSAEDSEIKESLIQSWIEYQLNKLSNQKNSIQKPIDSQFYFKEQEDVPGIINETNTCYQNALLQILKHGGIKAPMSTVLFAKYNNSEDPLLNFLKKPAHKTISLKRDHPKLRTEINKLFIEKKQQDAEDFFNKLPLIDGLAPKVIRTAFAIKNTLDNACISCGYNDKTNSNLNKIDLSLTQSYDLSEMLQESVQNTATTCPCCHNTFATYQQKKSRQPLGKYLMIQLPMKYKKITTEIEGTKIKETIFDKNAQFKIEETIFLEKSNWRLIGAIFHYGENFMNGHYISLVNKQNTWFICDDTYTAPIDPFISSKNNNQIKLLKKIGNEFESTAKPYLLFYEHAG